MEDFTTKNGSCMYLCWPLWLKAYFQSKKSLIDLYKYELAEAKNDKDISIFRLGS